MAGARGARALVLTCLVVALLAPEVAAARDAVVRSFDGTPIVTHFYEAAPSAGRVRAPTVLVGAGFPEPGNTDPARSFSDQIGVTTLRAEGYNVVTWDPRGLGRSGGTVMFDSPDFEARDVLAIVDFVAAQPDALLDAPGDPRIGMSGSSYGGAIQFASAALDRRIDAIVPDSAWHSLEASLAKDGAIKTAWMVTLCGGGATRRVLDGALLRPAGLQAGAVDAAARAVLRRRARDPLRVGDEPGLARRARIRPAACAIGAPALIMQGTPDTLFALGEAIANHEALRATGIPLKMLWHCGGHGACLTGIGEHAHVAHAGLAWLARWLKRDTSVDTGPAFEWLADDGRWRGAAGYPLASAGTLPGAGAGSLVIAPTDSAVESAIAAAGYVLGGPFTASPASNAVNVAFAPPAPDADIVGEPTVKLTYDGTAVPARTFLYAQVIDGANRVVGGQVTPIPVVLDGSERTVERRLEVIAAHAGRGSRYALQIAPASTLFVGAQTSTGAVTLRDVEATLPLVAAAAGASTPPRRTPRRPVVSVSSRRVGAISRVVVRARLRSRPCRGTMTFVVRVGATRRTRRASIASSCVARAIVRMPVRRRSLARIAVSFDGNDELEPRRSRTVRQRLR